LLALFNEKTMAKPTVADIKPINVTLEKDKTYFFCACGQSNKQPFCDGSHAGSEFTPQKFIAKSSADSYLCQCKHSHNKPYCDGSHKDFSRDDIGKAIAVKNNTSADKMPVVKATKEEPTIAYIHQLANNGLSSHHGDMVAMGVPRYQLPDWDDIQILTAQLATRPLLDDDLVNTEVIIGVNAKKPLTLAMPLFVSDMSFGALSQEAKIALAKGAELAGTGICSGEGGMLPEEQAENSRYFYELASAQFGYSEDKLLKIQAFHFKGGQAAKTGTGGHLPADKVSTKIAEVRGLKVGEDAVSPATFIDLKTVDDFKKVADRVRAITGGIPIGFKLSANHIESDIDFALAVGIDYIILDGRGGGTGAAPQIFRDHISVPTIAALARAKSHLNKLNRQDISLVITGGLRTAPDFIKAMALGADAIALSNSALQAIGCVGARMCNTNLCPAGIATQNEALRRKLNVDESAEKLARFFSASTQLMQVMARACGHNSLAKFTKNDLCSWKKNTAELAGINYAGSPAK
jgi:methylamine---glutamate N-methyltransferase subunit C